MAEILIQLRVVVIGVAALLVTPILFVALDFWAGIRKAHQRGEKIRSDKMQRTLQKLSRYYNAILAMLVVDAIQISAFTFLHIYNDWTLWTLPVFTLLGVGFTAAVEIKSILEPADAKEAKEMREVTELAKAIAVTELAKAIAEHKSDPKEVAEAIAEYLNKNNQTNKD